jgi:phosphatidylglycerophosphate synthase
MERPERIAVIITASVFTGIFNRHWIFEIALWVLAVFTNITAVQRILHVRNRTKGKTIPS